MNRRIWIIEWWSTTVLVWVPRMVAYENEKNASVAMASLKRFRPKDFETRIIRYVPEGDEQG